MSYDITFILIGVLCFIGSATAIFAFFWLLPDIMEEHRKARWEFEALCGGFRPDDSEDGDQ